MIQHKHVKGWRIDGNREWSGGLLDEIQMLARQGGKETLEEENIRLSPNDWDVIDHENDDTRRV